MSNCKDMTQFSKGYLSALSAVKNRIELLSLELISLDEDIQQKILGHEYERDAMLDANTQEIV